MKQVILNYGGGLDSTGIICLMREKGLKPDKIIFADTGGERPDIYSHLDRVDKLLTSWGWDKIIRVKNKSISLEDYCIKNKTLPSLAYGFKTCSQRWKVRPIAQYLRSDEVFMEQMKKDNGFIKIIGFDVSELDRAETAKNSVKNNKNTEEYKLNFDLWFPLIDWGVGRKELKEIVSRHGLCPAKSSCFFCPAMSPYEVIKLNDIYPDLAKRAISIEENADLKTSKGLGRSWSWSDAIKADERQLKLFDDPSSSLGCGCINW